MWTTFFNMLLKFLYLTPQYLIAVAALAAICLFGPDRVLKYLSVHDFAQHNRAWLGLCFVASLTLFSVHWAVKIIETAMRRVWNAVLNKKAVNEALQYLHTLTEGEKQILRLYVAKKTRTNRLRVNDGVVQGLVAAGIIYPACLMGSGGFCVEYNLSDFAWDYLNEHNSLLRGTTNTYRTDSPDDFG